MPISSHKINLGTILLDAMEESEVTENASFGGFTCPTTAMFVTQGRPRIGHFLVAQLPLCGTAQQTGTLGSTRSSGSALDLSYLDLGSQQPGDHRLSPGGAHVLHQPNQCIWVHFIM